jgi:hypothetical protein
MSHNDLVLRSGRRIPRSTEASPVTPRNPPQHPSAPAAEHLPTQEAHHPAHEYLQSPEAAGARVMELTRAGQAVCDERDALRQAVEQKEKMLHSAESQHLDL